MRQDMWTLMVALGLAAGLVSCRTIPVAKYAELDDPNAWNAYDAGRTAALYLLECIQAIGFFSFKCAKKMNLFHCVSCK